MDNISQQSDEMEVLKSIFGDQWQVDENTGVCSIDITKEVKLMITLCPTYPSDSLPDYELFAPVLSLKQKQKIKEEFKNLYDSEGGGPLIYQMITILDEAVKDSKKILEATDIPIQQSSKIAVQKKQSQLKITHGPIITDRKSVFQGHACEVKSKQDVADFMDELLENRKIAQATHNISAYRMTLPNNIVLQDCDDDGENKASSRVLELLQNSRVNNVMVVVSRWYGGIQLGPDRFRHINNAARQALVQAGFIKT